jgi:hypothetical protein
VGGRQRAQKDVDRRPDAVLLRPTVERDLASRDDQVAVVRRHVDAAGPERVAIPGLDDLERRPAAQDLRQQAAPGRRHVQDHADGCAEVGRQVPDQPDQRVDAACGGADPDDAPGRSGALGSS